jgi:hypothetical protein
VYALVWTRWRVALRLAWYLWSAARCPTPAIALWREQLIAGFDRLAGRLASADQDDDVLARCTADEFVLHLTINLAEAHLIDDVVSPAAVCPSPRPRSGRRGLQLDARGSSRTTTSSLLFNPRSTASRTPSAGTPRCVTGTWFTLFRGGVRLVSSRRSMDEDNVRVSDTEASWSITPAVCDARPSLRLRLRLGHGDLEGNDGERSLSDRATLGGTLGSSGRRSRTALDNPSFQPWARRFASATQSGGGLRTRVDGAGSLRVVDQDG